jgi:hypothetical protein
MAILNDSKLQNLEYFEAHTPVWAANAVAIGLTVANTTLLAGKVTSARKAYNDMIVARNAAKNATQTWYDNYSQMAALGRDDIRTIKAFADQQANPLTVYTLAQVEPPAQPGPPPVPGTPEMFNITINPASGDLTLKWKCIGDGNAVYLISRQFANQTAPQFVTAVGGKTFTDTTLGTITGASLPVSYFVTCQRGTMSGATASVTVRLGSGGGGGGFSMVENAPMKMAA